MQTTTSLPTPSKSEKAGGRLSLPRLSMFVYFALAILVVIALDQPPRPLPERAPDLAFSAVRAARHLAFISRAPHPVNSPEHDVVRDYILNTLRTLGYAPEVQKTAAINERYGVPGAVENILCRLKGSDPGKAVLLVAHYDSVAAGPGASDDGAAVAAFLETARILKSLPQQKRDIVFLFSDGEEEGLLGAQAFVLEHPWAHEVGIVLNFEARGTSGPSIMFETSNRNGWLIDNFAAAASHPVANSLSYEIYKRLPNDTDLTVFQHAGYSGMNFAYIDNVVYYHKPLDSVQNLDLGSLQQQGDYALEMARQFGNTASDDPRPANVVYFDVFGKMLVRYGGATATFLVVLAGLALLSTLFLGFRRKLLRGGALVIGFLAFLAGAVITTFMATSASWVAAALRPHFYSISQNWLYHPGWFVGTFSVVGLSCAVAFYWMIAKFIGPANLAAGTLLGWLGMAFAVRMYVPGGSYLFIWPLLFSTLPWLAMFARQRLTESAKNGLVMLCGIPSVILLGGMAHKIFFAFAAKSTMFVSTLLGLLLSLLISQIVHGITLKPRRNTEVAEVRSAPSSELRTSA
jgi:hypothetical protein